MAAITRGLRGQRADRDGRAARRRRARLHRRRQARSSAPGCCARRCSTSGCAAACSPCTRRTRRSRGGGVMHEGAVSALLGIAGIPSDQRVDDGRARRARSPATRAARVHIQHLSVRRVGRGGRARPRPHGVRVTGEASPHHLLPHRRGRPHARHAHEDEPAAAHRGRPPGADRRACATATIDCVATDHAPHARDEKEVPFEQAPMGTTGLETAFAALYTELVLPGVLPLGLRRRADDRRRRAARPADAADRASASRRTSCSSTSTPSWEVGEDGYESRSENCCFAGRDAARPGRC